MAQPTSLPERPPAPVVWEAGQASPAGYVSSQASELHVLVPIFPQEEDLGLELSDWRVPPVSAFSGQGRPSLGVTPLLEGLSQTRSDGMGACESA